MMGDVVTGAVCFAPAVIMFVWAFYRLLFGPKCPYCEITGHRAE